MGLAPYFSRVHDSIGAVAAVSAEELSKLLLDLTVHVRLGTDTCQGAGLSGAVLLTNLLSRLYPRLRLSGSDDLVAELAQIAKAINPDITVNAPGDGRSVEIWFGAQPNLPGPVPGDHTPHVVDVRPQGWRVVLDPSPADSDDAPGIQGGEELAPEPRPASPLTWQAAACMAAAEVFRYAFRDALGRDGRYNRQPGSFNLLNGGSDDVQVDTDLSGRQLPDLHLAGAGAIGQAALLALRESGVRATVTVVDPQDVELSNLQRYVLSIPSDVGRSKVDVAVEALKGSSVTVTAVRTAWGADQRSHPGQRVVLVALDSARDRLGVAAGMHGRVYNAWTQPSDLGWSRHEALGEQPCLACLYLPTHV